MVLCLQLNKNSENIILISHNDNVYIGSNEPYKKLPALPPPKTFFEVKNQVNTKDHRGESIMWLTIYFRVWLSFSFPLVHGKQSSSLYDGKLFTLFSKIEHELINYT